MVLSRFSNIVVLSSYFAHLTNDQIQVVVFEDIDFSEHVRIEVRGVRKLGENPVLASLDFEVK